MKVYNERPEIHQKVAIVKTHIANLGELTPFGRKLKQYDIDPKEVIYISLFDKKMKKLAVADLRVAMLELTEMLKVRGINIIVDEVNYHDGKKYHNANIFSKIFHKDTDLWSTNGIMMATLNDINIKMVCGFRGDAIAREMDSAKIIDTEFVVDFAKANIETITDGNRAKEVFRKLHKENEEIFYDTETNSLRWEMIGAKLLTIQFTGNSDKYTSYVMFIDHKDVTTINNMKEVCSVGTKWLLESGKKVWIHNANFDLLFTKQCLCSDLDFYKVNSYDTMLIYHFLTNTYKSIPLGLKESAFVNKISADWETDLEMSKTDICKDLKLKKKDFSYELFDSNMLAKYAGLDTIVLAYYVDMLWKLNEKHPAKVELNIIKETWEGNWQNIMQSIQWTIFYGVPFDIEECKKQLASQEAEIDRRLQKILESPDVQKATILINKENFEKAKEQYNKKCRDAQEKGKEFKGTKPDFEKGNYGSVRFDVQFKPSSDAHKRILLHEVLKLPVLQTTDKGLPSVSSEVISQLFDKRPDIEILKLFNEIATIEKEITTYLRPWIELSETSFDGNLRSNFTPTATSLRLRSRSPNLLNISKSDIKKCIKTTNEDNIFQADYSGLEDWAMLFRHQDPVKMELKRKGIDDAHSISAIIIDKALGNGKLDKYSMTEPEDLKEIKSKFPKLRQNGKALTFSMLFLGSHRSICATYNVDNDTGLSIYNTYWDAYKGERQFLLNKVQEMEEGGYLINFGKAPIKTKGIYGDLNDKDNMSNIRTSYNSIGQSSAYSTLRAMDKTMRRLKEEGIYYRPFLSVYDSIIYTCRNEDAIYIRDVMNKYMTEPIMDNQPMSLKVDFEIGHSYKAEEDFEGTEEELKEILSRFK